MLVLYVVEAVLERVLSEEAADEDLKELLALECADDLTLLFEAACKVRRRYFANKVFVYGFVYCSTYCRNNCSFCFYRRSNTHAPRYRLEKDRIYELSSELVSSGVHLIDITLGEDPYHFKNDFTDILEVISCLRDDFDIPIMVSPGVVSQSILKRFKEAGADWYACYQETHSIPLYSLLRRNQGFVDRLRVKALARREGLLIEDGILIGVNETLDDRVRSVREMKRMGSHQARAMSFVPQEGTPLEDTPPSGLIEELKMIAVLRLVLKDRLIPASLDVEGLSGLRSRLDAGANVVTSLIPPASGLKGVAQSVLDIDDGGRTLQGVLPVVEAMGLEIAAPESYREWIGKEVHI